MRLEVQQFEPDKRDMWMKMINLLTALQNSGGLEGDDEIAVRDANTALRYLWEPPERVEIVTKRKPYFPIAERSRAEEEAGE